MILVTRCYSEITPESAEDGECSDTGIIVENEELTFRGLVRMMRDYGRCSCSHPTGAVGEWLSTHYYVHDYCTGTEREESLHYSHDNPARCAKYWRWAMRAAGIIKR